MSLDVVIVSWNTRELLARCLASVFAAPPACPLTVWVVDNASTDGSAAMVAAQFPQVRLIANTDNRGFAPANNQALRVGRAAYALLLNSDTEVHPGALAALVEFLDAHARAGAAGAYLLNADGSLQVSCFPFPTIARELALLFHVERLFPPAAYPMARWSVDQPRLVDSVRGACLILRRAALDAVGLLDEDYFMYTEEVDLCYRLRRAGWDIWWAPQARVIHFGGQSSRQVADEMFMHLYRSKRLFFRKQYGPFQAALYRGTLLAAAGARVSLAQVGVWLRWDRPDVLHAKVRQYRRLFSELLAA